MKKSVMVLVVLVLCLTLLFAFTACNKEDNEPYDNSLQMDTMYSLFNIDKSEINGFTFHSDGTGEYRVYYGTRNFTCHFIYEYLNEDKREIAIFRTQTEFHGESKELNSTCSHLYYSQATLKVSKNVVYYTYISGGNVSTTPYRFVTAELQEKYDRINSELKELNKDSQT